MIDETPQKTLPLVIMLGIIILNGMFLTCFRLCLSIFLHSYDSASGEHLVADVYVRLYNGGR